MYFSKILTVNTTVHMLVTFQSGVTGNRNLLYKSHNYLCIITRSINASDTQPTVHLMSIKQSNTSLADLQDELGSLFFHLNDLIPCSETEGHNLSNTLLERGSVCYGLCSGVLLKQCMFSSKVIPSIAIISLNSLFNSSNFLSKSCSSNLSVTRDALQSYLKVHLVYQRSRMDYSVICVLLTVCRTLFRTVN